MYVGREGSGHVTILRPHSGGRWLFAVLYAAAVSAYYLSPATPGWISPYFTVCLGLAVAGMAAGCAASESRRKPAWLLLLAGTGLSLLGNGAALAYLKIAGSVPYPSASDALELSSYLFFVAGLALLSRGGGLHLNARATAVSAVVTGLAAGLFSWPALVSPYAAASTISLFAKVVTIAYPAGDVLLLFQVVILALVALAMRHFSTAARLSASFWLIAAGALGFLASDSLFAYAALHWNWSQPSVTDIGWLTWLGTWALAFLSPGREMPAKTWYLTKKKAANDNDGP